MRLMWFFGWGHPVDDPCVTLLLGTGMRSSSWPRGRSVSAVPLDDPDIDAIDWPACSQDLNLIRRLLDVTYRSIRSHHATVPRRLSGTSLMKPGPGLGGDTPGGDTWHNWATLGVPIVQANIDLLSMS